MLLDDKKIKQEQKWVGNISKAVKEHNERCHILSDPTRAKIIILLEKHKELCVSDIAEILKVSVSAISHQLSLLERQDVVESKKMGKVVCYNLRMKDNIIAKCLSYNLPIRKLK